MSPFFYIPMSANHNLSVDEKMKSREEIRLLFSKGKRMNSYPVSILYTWLEEDNPEKARILFSAPKRRLRKAVDRNKAKRQLREIYRQHKAELPVKEGKTLLLALIYQAVEIREFNEVKDRLILSLRKLRQKETDA